MSADDWIPCPFCSEEYRKQIAELKLELKRAYLVKTAKDYDNFRRQTEMEIDNLSQRIEEVSARIDGVRDYGFDKDGNFRIHAGAFCPHCKREWDGEMIAKPNFEEDE